MIISMSPTLSRAFMATSSTLAPSPSLQLPAIHTSGSPVYTVIITVSLILLLMCALGMHFLIRCILKCSRSTDLELQEERASQILGKKQANVSKIELKLLPTAVYTSKLPWPASSSSSSSSLKEKNTQCPICLSDFKEGETIRALPMCNHGFHIACIDAWLCNHPNCPTCRHDLTHHTSSKCESTFIGV